MKIFSTLLVFIFAVWFAPSLQADIFIWIDENGVQRFSNYSPPTKAELFIKTSEIPSDAAANRKQAESEWLQKEKDTEKEITRLREELEAVKKLLEESKNAAETNREEVRDEQSVYPQEPQVYPQNHIGDTYVYGPHVIYSYIYPYASYRHPYKVHPKKTVHHKKYHHGRYHRGYADRYHYRKKHLIKRHVGQLNKHYYNKRHIGY